MRKKNNLVVPIIIVVLLAISVIVLIKGQTNMGVGQSVLQTISGTGGDFQLALDGDQTTAWQGLNYGKYAQITFEYKDTVTLKKVKWLLGSPAEDISYIVMVRTSKDGIHWDEALPPTYTNYFTGNEWYEEDFTKSNVRFIEVGANVNSELLPFEVYEIELEVE